MVFDSLLAALSVASVSLVGIIFFGGSGRLNGIERYSIPVAVGVFLSLILFELIPETLTHAKEYGPFVIGFGFISFYVLGHILHTKFHTHEAEDCDNKGAAILILIGDAVHNIADGVVIAGAFMLDPGVGVLTTIGLILHELPQEIVEYGILIRAGYSRARALILNFFSASTVFIGVIVMRIVAEHAEEYSWVLLGLAAGNLLFIALCELMPRIHGTSREYGNIWNSTISITLGFIIMATVLHYTHEHYGHGAENIHGTDFYDEKYEGNVHTE